MHGGAKGDAPHLANEATVDFSNRPDMQLPKSLGVAEFPWPEMRDFISVLISKMLAQQNLMVGEKMLDAKAAGITEEQVNNVRDTFKHLEMTTQQINQVIEQKLLQWEGKAPKLLIARG